MITTAKMAGRWLGRDVSRPSTMNYALKKYFSHLSPLTSLITSERLYRQSEDEVGLLVMGIGGNLCKKRQPEMLGDGDFLGSP